MKLSDYFETDRSFYKKLFMIALPLAAQNIITVGVNLVDNIMLGQLGETAMSASTQANHYITLFQFCIMGISMGSAVLTSRFWGAKDIRSLKQAVTIALRIAILMALGVTLISAVFAEPILRLYSTDAVVIREGVRYLLWSLPTFLLTALSTVCTNVLRSVNLGRIPLAASIAAFAVNIGANYIFIFGKAGAPAMGVAGAALGTVIARVLETAIICGYFLTEKHHIGYGVFGLFGKCRGMLREYLRTSIPVLVSDGLLGVGDNALAVIMGRIGDQFVAATSIINVTQRVTTILISSISFASCFMIGQVLGEGDSQRAKKQGTTFFALGIVIGTVAACLVQLIKGPMINVYNITEETRAIAFALMNAISIIIVFRSTNSILTKGVLRAGGDTRFLMVADVLFLWVVAIPLGALTGIVWKLPPFWVYLFLYSDQILKAIWCVFRLHGGKWIKHISGSKN